MKRLLLLSIILLGFGVRTSVGQTPPLKHALVEEVTGTWCGGCVVGIWEQEQLRQNYPGQYFYVSFHGPSGYGEVMEMKPNSIFDSMTSGQFGYPAFNYRFPNSWINRRAWDGDKLDQDPDSWDYDVQNINIEPPDADVTVTDVKYDTATRTVTGTVNAKFLVDTAGDIRLNMYVTEDSVSGPPGSAYDQHNYLSNDPRYGDDRFVHEPVNVPGVQHMGVARAILGGVDGIAAIIPGTVKKGLTYSVTFTYTVPKEYNVAHCNLVGFAFYYNEDGDVTNLEVLNADQQPVTTIPLVRGIKISAKNQAMIAERSTQTSQPITIKNSNSVPVQVSLSLDGKTQIHAFPNAGEAYVIPNALSTTGWTATITPATITVPPNDSAVATFTITAPANANFVATTIDATLSADGMIENNAQLMIEALSANTKYINIGWNGVFPGAITKYKSDYAVLPWDSLTLSSYDMTKFDIVIVDPFVLDYTGDLYDSWAIEGGTGPAVMPIINAVLNAGNKVLITSPWSMYYANDSKGGLTNLVGTQATKDFFTMLGIQYDSKRTKDYGTTLTQVKFSGIPGDAIGDGLTLNPYLLHEDFFTITDPTHTTPIMYSGSKAADYVGVKYDGGNGKRIVYLATDFGWAYFSKPQQDYAANGLLISKSMDFLLNGVDAVSEPSVSNFTLDQNYPNPVTIETKIGYSLSERTPVTITVHDILGREVGRLVNMTQEAGTYTVNFDVSNLPAGSYIYTLNAGGKTIEKTMSVAK